MDCGYGVCWLSMMGFDLLWVFWWWWIPIYGGFVVGLSFFFFFRLCGRWLFKVVVVGSIWGGFEMEVVVGFNLGWICSEVVVGYEVVIEIFGFY